MLFFRSKSQKYILNKKKLKAPTGRWQASCILQSRWSNQWICGSTNPRHQDFEYEVLTTCLLCPFYFQNENSLTQVKKCNRSVAVQFSFEIFILTVNFNSLGIEVNGIAVIFLSVCFITFVKVNLSYR